MGATHEADKPLAGSVESSIREAAQNGLLIAADLTSVASAKAEIDGAAANLHVSQRPLAFGPKRAIDLVDNFVSGASSGESLTNIYAGIDGTWNPGFPVVA